MASISWRRPKCSKTLAIEVEDLDVSADYGEDRFLILGRAGDRLLMVVYTERQDRIRIISAREATI
jgi:uncharacterized DUF497 family protein